MSPAGRSTPRGPVQWPAARSSGRQVLLAAAHCERRGCCLTFADRDCREICLPRPRRLVMAAIGERHQLIRVLAPFGRDSQRRGLRRTAAAPRTVRGAGLCHRSPERLRRTSHDIASPGPRRTRRRLPRPRRDTLRFWCHVRDGAAASSPAADLPDQRGLLPFRDLNPTWTHGPDQCRGRLHQKANASWPLSSCLTLTPEDGSGPNSHRAGMSALLMVRLVLR